MAGRDVAEGEVAGGEVGEAANAGGGGDAAAEVGEVGREGVGEGLCATVRDGPSYGVGGGSEDEAEGGAEGLIESHEGVRGEAGEERSGWFGAEAAGYGGGGEEGVQAEAGEQERVLREGDCGAEDVGGEVGPAGGERLHEAAPGGAVFAEGGFGLGEVAVEGDGGAVVERVGQGGGGVDPFEAVVGEGQGGEEGRAYGEGVDCGAEVVVEAGESEVECAGGAADFRFGFKDFDVQAGLCEHDSGRESVGT